MELLIGFAILGVVVAGVYAFVRESVHARRRRQRSHRPPPSPVPTRYLMERRRQNLLARRLQIALFDLPNAPDFRRAASWAAHCRGVPLAFRQRQFRRFRAKLLEHFVRRLRSGSDAEALMHSLIELLGQLGIPAFEAEYLRAEAQRRVVTPTQAEPSYAQQLAEAQRDHAHRVAALREVPGIDEDTRAQLVEAEENRFRQELMQSQNPATTNRSTL